MGKTYFIVCFKNQKEPKDNQAVRFSFLAIGNTKQQNRGRNLTIVGAGLGACAPCWQSVLPTSPGSGGPGTCEVKDHREAGVCEWNGWMDVRNLMKEEAMAPGNRSDGE